MIGEIAGHSELAAVKRAVAKAVDALIGVDLQCDEISSRRADEDLGVFDLHSRVFFVAGHCLDSLFGLALGPDLHNKVVEG